MAATGRVRRSIRYAQLDAQTGPAVSSVPLRRQRMTESARLSAPSFQNTQDWTGGMGISPSGRFQVIEEPLRKQPLFSRDGVRMDLAGALLWLMAVGMAVILLVLFASVGAGSLRIRRLESRIESAQNIGDNLRRQLNDSSGDISVVTKAVELNLISSEGAPTIRLTAPKGATMTLVRTGTPEPTEEPELRAGLGGSE